MHKYLEIIRKKAAENPQRIVFPEGGEERILQAVEEILKQNLAKPILIGEKNQIMEKYEQEGSAYFGTSRIWDDGIIDPVDTRKMIGLGLSIAANKEVPDYKPGIYRM